MTTRTPSTDCDYGLDGPGCPAPAGHHHAGCAAVADTMAPDPAAIGIGDDCDGSPETCLCSACTYWRACAETSLG